MSHRGTVVITCDHPDCPAEVTAATQWHANDLAQRSGWAQRPDLTGQPGPHDLCPAHWTTQEGTHHD